jgi:hypothetical protein
MARMSYGGFQPIVDLTAKAKKSAKPAKTAKRAKTAKSRAR